jgi:hypothetical protein
VRILLDENLPVALAAELKGHEVATVTGLGWDGLKNSELLRRAQGRFHVLITMDSNLEFQQNIADLGLAVLILVAPSNRLVHLRPLVEPILAALEGVPPGAVRRVGA